MKAVYSESADRILMYFNVPTNRGGLTGKFNCSLLLVSTFSFGPTSYCAWSNSTLLVAFLDELSTDYVGSSIFTEGKIRNELGNSDTGLSADSRTVTVQFMHMWM